MMKNCESILNPVKIPRMVPVRQNFDKTCLVDVAGAVRKDIDRDEIRNLVKPGMSIAITAGSRGISNLAIIIREVVSFLKELGAHPFVIPAMGSHGGASADGQKAIITEYGVTEDFVGCPVKATMEVVDIGQVDDGRSVYVNKLAHEADAIIPLGRIKAHTAFRGTYESGVMKMMTIGLGCQRGAESCHSHGIMELGPSVEKFAKKIISTENIIFGVGIIENAYDQTFLVHAMTKDQILSEEPELLKLAKSKMSRILFDDADVLIVDYIGKDISGEGMDPNVAGRWIVPNIQGGLHSKIIAVLDITDKTLGNVVGLGMADVCSERVVNKLSRDNTYPNSLTSTVTCLCKIPMYFDNHRMTIKAGIKMAWNTTPDTVRVIRIKDTLSMDTIWISENMIPELDSHPDIEIIGSPEELIFDGNGDLF